MATEREPPPFLKAADNKALSVLSSTYCSTKQLLIFQDLYTMIFWTIISAAHYSSSLCAWSFGKMQLPRAMVLYRLAVKICSSMGRR